MSDYRALSSAWTECLASDQTVGGSNPSAPVPFCDGLHLADGSTTLINHIPSSRFDFVTLRNGAGGVLWFAKTWMTEQRLHGRFVTERS